MNQILKFFFFFFLVWWDCIYYKSSTLFHYNFVGRNSRQLIASKIGCGYWKKRATISDEKGTINTLHRMRSMVPHLLASHPQSGKLFQLLACAMNTPTATIRRHFQGVVSLLSTESWAMSFVGQSEQYNKTVLLQVKKGPLWCQL